MHPRTSKSDTFGIISRCMGLQGPFKAQPLKDPVLSIMHCALQKSAAIFLMLKNLVGLIALRNPFASAMSVVKRLFMYLIYKATLKNVF